MQRNTVSVFLFLNVGALSSGVIVRFPVPLDSLSTCNLCVLLNWYSEFPVIDSVTQVTVQDTCLAWSQNDQSSHTGYTQKHRIPTIKSVKKVPLLQNSFA